MDKLIRSALILCLLWSCNVVKLATQGETEVPDEFFVGDVIPFQVNPLTRIYTKTESYINEINKVLPTSAIPATSGAVGAANFAGDWNGNLIFSNNNSQSLTTAKWIFETVKKQEVVYSNGNKYDSPTWSALHMINSICAAGILFGDELGLMEYDYPADNTYSKLLNSSALYALSKYCGVKDDGGMLNQTIQVTISTPTNTTIYDKRIDMMGNTYYIRYNSQGMALAGLESYSSGANFRKVVLYDDLISNGFSLSYIDGPLNTVLTNEQVTAMRLYYDSTGSLANPTAAMMLRETYNTAPDSQTTFFVGGNLGDGVGVTVNMNSSSLTGGPSITRSACLNNTDWSLTIDGNNCSGNSGLTGISTDGTSAASFYNIFAGWSGSYSNNSTVTETSTPGFTVLENMGTGAF